MRKRHLGPTATDIQASCLFSRGTRKPKRLLPTRRPCVGRPRTKAEITSCVISSFIRSLAFHITFCLHLQSPTVLPFHETLKITWSFCCCRRRACCTSCPACSSWATGAGRRTGPCSNAGPKWGRTNQILFCGFNPKLPLYLVLGTQFYGGG